MNEEIELPNNWDRDEVKFLLSKYITKETNTFRCVVNSLRLMDHGWDKYIYVNYKVWKTTSRWETPDDQTSRISIGELEKLYNPILIQRNRDNKLNDLLDEV